MVALRFTPPLTSPHTGTSVCGKPSDMGGGQQEEEDPVWSDCQVPGLYKTGCGGSLGSSLNMTSWAVLLIASVLLVAPGEGRKKEGMLVCCVGGTLKTAPRPRAPAARDSSAGVSSFCSTHASSASNKFPRRSRPRASSSPGVSSRTSVRLPGRPIWGSGPRGQRPRRQENPQQVEGA